MGMFDTIRWVDPGEAPRCAAGHALVEFQTKDRAWPGLERFYVRGTTVYELAADSRTEAVVSRDGRLLLEQATELAPVTSSESLVMTTTCTQCDPILSWSRESHGCMRREYPLQQFRLTIAFGNVASCEPIERETSSSLYEEQKRLGLRVVPIDSDLYRELLEDSAQAGR